MGCLTVVKTGFDLGRNVFGWILFREEWRVEPFYRTGN